LVEKFPADNIATSAQGGGGLTHMFDALEELADLSLALQKADISLATTHRMIARQITHGRC